MAGLDENGFTPKTFTEIQDELRTAVSDNFQGIGETVNVNPNSRFGQLIDIFSAQIAEAWDGLQDIYNSYFPLTATGASLDEANSLTNTPRLQATSSRAGVYLLGDANTNVPQGLKMLVDGTTSDEFLLSSKTTVGPLDTSDYVIGDTSSHISSPFLASAGSIEIGYDGTYGLSLPYTASAATIKANLEALANVTEVEVTGNFDGTDLSVGDEGPMFLHVRVIDASNTSNILEVQNNTLLSYQDIDLTFVFDGLETSTITYANLALTGTIQLGFDGINFATVNWNDSAIDIQSALEALPGITTVAVVGRFDVNTIITVQVTSGSPKSLTSRNNNLQFGLASVLTINFASDEPANTLSLATGPVTAPVGDLTILQDSAPGWEGSYNPLEAILGRDRESDAAYRLRRFNELARQGTSTAGGIREAVVDAINADVYNVSIVENDSDDNVLGVGSFITFVVTYSPDVIAGDTIEMTVDTLPITPVPFNTTAAQTYIDVAAAVTGLGLSNFTSATGTATGVDIIFSDDGTHDVTTVVTGGASGSVATVGGNFRPPHSFEVFVNALDDDSTNNAIAQAIYDSKSLGIEVVSTDGLGRNGSAVDVNGDNLIVPFTSTLEIDVTMTITIITDQQPTLAQTYPTDGEDQIKTAIVNFFVNYGIGDDVLTHSLFTPANTPPGIVSMDIVTAKKPDGETAANLTIEAFEAATIVPGDIVIVDNTP